jgi:cytochrome c biogenesis protein CcdA
MAARGENLGEAAATMLAFGVGAALPLLAIGLASREALMRWRSRLLAAGTGGRRILGGALVVVGALVLAGLDKRLEAAIVAVSPEWLTRLTTAF